MAASPLIARALLATLVATSAVLALQEQQQPQQHQEPSQVPTLMPVAQENLGPSYEQAPADKAAVWPMVDVDHQQNKSTVDVHVPIFFDMTNHKDADSGRQKLDLSVLQGLVTVNKDRAPNQNGQMTGPLKVTVFGIPVYQGKAHPVGPQQELEDSISQTRSSLSERANEVSSQAVDKVHHTSEKLLSGLSNFLDRLGAMVRQASQAVGSSQAGHYHQPAREQRQQQQQPLPYEQQQQQQQHQNQPPSSALNRAESNQIERSLIRSARDEQSMH